VCVYGAGFVLCSSTLITIYHNGILCRKPEVKTSFRTISSLPTTPTLCSTAQADEPAPIHCHSPSQVSPHLPRAFWGCNACTVLCSMYHPPPPRPPGVISVCCASPLPPLPPRPGYFYQASTGQLQISAASRLNVKGWNSGMTANTATNNILAK